MNTIPKAVVLYTQPGCLFCGRVKEFLRQKNIEFTEKDVAADEAAFDEVTALGFAATPVTIIDGAAVVGFNRSRLEQLLSA